MKYENCGNNKRTRIEKFCLEKYSFHERVFRIGNTFGTDSVYISFIPGVPYSDQFANNGNWIFL